MAGKVNSGMINTGEDWGTGCLSSAGRNLFPLGLLAASGCNLSSVGLSGGGSVVFGNKFSWSGRFGGGGLLLLGIVSRHVVFFRWVIFFNPSVDGPYLVLLRKRDD